MNEKTFRVLEYNKIISMLVEKAASSLGKEKIKNLKPETNFEKVEHAQKETEEALTILIKRGNPPLYGIYPIFSEMKRAEMGGVLGPESLLKISDTLRVSRGLKGYIRENKEDRYSSYPIIESLIEELTVLEFIEDAINKAIVSKDEISDNASPKLKNIRRQLIIKNDSIKNKLNSIITSTKYRKYLQDEIVTVREGRYVVPVKQEYRSNVPGLIHDQSASGVTLFIEPIAVVELNNELKELEIKERKEIERILADLTNMVAIKSGTILANLKILEHIDFIFAKGKLALEMDGIKPILNENGYINIKNGKHPILDVKKVVPIDIYIGKDFETLVITGPNTGGKTVTLKTVGLLTLMAQSGLHIPADSNSEMAVFDQIFADIGDEQSIEQSLSTFSGHLTNIVEILENVRDNSLLLFDELGAGTDPTEGAALAMSILDYLKVNNARTIATTHYSQLKIYALTEERVKNASVEFDVDTLSPTYRLLTGVPGKSNAFEISKRLGLDTEIINYARTLISKENLEFEEVLQAIDRDRKLTEVNKFEAEKYKKESEELRRELLEEKRKIDDIREKTILAAKKEARDILRNAKKEADEAVSGLREISIEIEKEKAKRIQETQEKLKGKVDNIESDLVDNVLNVKSNEPPKNLNAGEEVEILSLNQKGIVLSEPDEDGNVSVQVGIMKVNVDISTLRRTKIKELETAETNTKNIIKRKAKNVRNEVDLRGKTLDEALLDLDKYLDDVYITGLKEAYIIHGKGTGVLRAGITNVLKNHRYIKTFRLGNHGEGGSGVTVIELK